MKSKDIDINQFEKIEDLYAFVDQNAFELERNWYITDLWVAYRNKSSDEGEKQKAQWEIDFSLFDVKGDKLFSQVYSSTETSERVKSYPNLNELQSEVIHYLTIRSEESSNPILKAKYNHLLWKCPNSIKHNKYVALQYHLKTNLILKLL